MEDLESTMAFPVNPNLYVRIMRNLKVYSLNKWPKQSKRWEAKRYSELHSQDQNKEIMGKFM